MRNLSGCAVVLLGLLLTATAAAQYHHEPFPFLAAETERVANSVTATATDDALTLRFGIADWPNLTFRAPDGGWDWSAYAGLGFRIHNPGDTSQRVSMRIDNPGSDGATACNTARGSIGAGRTEAFEALFNTGEETALWGMRGVPREAPRAHGDVLDRSEVVAFQLFLSKPDAPVDLVLEEVYLIRRAHDTATPVPLPFVDRFGQFMHDDWPGKVHDEKELIARRDAEAEALRAAPAPPAFDALGGWADGPVRAATGWFRTEEIDGQWWLVTPEGRLFYSTGVDCVGTWRRTFVEKREDWFDWLPAENDPRFGWIYGHQSGAHSMAEPINGAGRVFDFLPVNLIRKYGADWETRWRETTYARLRAWGFNTLGNWSQRDVLAHSPVPFTVSATISDVRPIAGATGYWAKMMDVYAPEFEVQVDRAVSRLAARWAENRLCIGYFIDNELAWEGVKRGALDSPADQPARLALLVYLEDRYETIAALNKAWDTGYDDWSQVARDKGDRRAMDADLDGFLEQFARRYFEVVAAAFDRHAPKQLYLGCRFSTAPEPAVRACAEFADVVSFNRYVRTLKPGRFLPEDAASKPVIIGEFHFGALDRGMFHTGLVPTESQADRAAHYAAYVESALACPEVVGTHWFQFVDEPITGRYYDGENYNIGFLDVTDTPYPELTRAAQAIHATLYALRGGDSATESVEAIR